MNQKKLAGLFINCPEAQDSIYESGKMAFECLQNSAAFSLDYFELCGDQNAVSAYDFYLFNYHILTMPRLDTKSLRESIPGVKMTIVLEVSPNDPFVYCSPNDFDAYCVLDPTLNIKQPNAFAFPRPLEAAIGKFDFQPPEIPVIGSFGFATPGKGFEHVVDAVNREFEKAVVKINIPYSTYADGSGERAKKLAQMCRDKARNGIEVVVTHDFMTKPELIEWCAKNTLNCFLYDRNVPGLAATTDQAITAGRPLITSKNNTFRHIQKYIKPFPYQSLQDAIEKTPEKVAGIQNDWSAEKFREKFEEVLETFQFDEHEKHSGIVKLPLFPVPKKSGLPAPLQNIKDLIGVRTRLKNYRSGYGFNLKPRVKTPPVKSYSQFGEDLIVTDLFAEIPIVNMSYLDIGANNPQFISNTYSFYERGFSGVLIEPNEILCEKLRTVRPRDLVLNVGVGTDEHASEADFYVFPKIADGLSTFSAAEAEHWQEVGMDGIKYQVEKIVKMPLLKINDIIADYFTECPDFISIDVEGWDLKILESFDFEKYSPAVFCVETLAYRSDGSTYRIGEIYELMKRNDYFSLAQTVANDVFVNRNLYDFYVYQKEQRRK